MDGTSQKQDQINAAVARIWQQKKSLTLVSIAAVERAAAALLDGSFTPELRAHAAIEAHKLAGSLGTFGFTQGSRLSRSMEEILTRASDLQPQDGQELSELLRQLHIELEPVSGC
jgi:HPt (histidine-containing phosphotransfer) domain-containing protein